MGFARGCSGGSGLRGLLKLKTPVSTGYPHQSEPIRAKPNQPGPLRRYLSVMTDEREHLPEPDDPIDVDLKQRLDALHTKVFRDAGSNPPENPAAPEPSNPPTEFPEVPDWEFKRPQIPGHQPHDASGYLGLGVGLSVAYTLVGMSLAGFGIGWLIDRGSGSYIAQGIGTLLGATIGLVAGIYTIIKAQNRGKGG